MVAVGFNPRLTSGKEPGVASRRMKPPIPKWFPPAQGVAPRRHIPIIQNPWVKTPRLPSMVAPRPPNAGFSFEPCNPSIYVSAYAPTSDPRPLAPSPPSPPTSDLRPPTSGLRPPTPDLRPPTPDLRPPTSDLRPPTSDPPTLRPPTSAPPDPRPPTSDPRPPTSDLRPPTSDLRPPTADLRPPTSGLRPSGLAAGTFSGWRGDGAGGIIAEGESSACTRPIVSVLPAPRRDLRPTPSRT
jgi:hypothetical protein